MTSHITSFAWICHISSFAWICHISPFAISHHISSSNCAFMARCNCPFNTAITTWSILLYRCEHPRGKLGFRVSSHQVPTPVLRLSLITSHYPYLPEHITYPHLPDHITSSSDWSHHIFPFAWNITYPHLPDHSTFLCFLNQIILSSFAWSHHISSFAWLLHISSFAWSHHIF